MLKARLMTGILYIAFIFAVIFALPYYAFAVVFAAISCFMLFEWMRMAGVVDSWQRFLWLDIFVLLLCLVAWWEPARTFAIIFALGFWSLVFIFLVLRQRYDVKLQMMNGVEVLLAMAVLVPAFSALLEIRELPQGQLLVLMLFVLLWASDSFAYASGRLFGKHKLATKISPGKTWEGLAGGLLLTIIALWFYNYFVLGVMAINITWFVLFAVLVIMATAGDLFESYIKRSHNVKDSGNILPGHGGLLDRLDSLLAAAPVFAFFAKSGVI